MSNPDMKSFKNLKKWLPLLLMICFATGLPAQCMVFPFQVDSLKKKNHQWLGLAISYYLTQGLELNSIETVSDSITQSLLNTYNIKFPYQISKASCIKLAMLAQAKTIVWGEVVASEDPQIPNVQIRTYIIAPETYSQKYLPLIKFYLKDFYTVKQELLNLVLNYFNKKSNLYPDLKLDYHHYETFVKSFLISDMQKKISLLETLVAKRPDSDFLNFEISKAYSIVGNARKSQQHLDKITDSILFGPSKQFLKTIHLIDTGQSHQATEILHQLQNEKQFMPETQNNLGVIQARESHHSRACDHFHHSLQAKKDPQVYFNYIKCLMVQRKQSLALENLKIALFYYPDDENLIRLFSFFLSLEKKSAPLLIIFKKYIPNLNLIKELPDLPFILKNPFELQTYDNLYYLNDFDRIVKLYGKGDTATALKNTQNLMEINPFIPRLHRFLAEIYEKQGDLTLSRQYSRSAIFLRRR